VHGIHCRPRAETLYTVHARWRSDGLTRAHFVLVLLLEIVLYILYTFYAPISVSLIDRSLLRLTNRTSSCYKLQIIDIVPFCAIVLNTFTILQYGISIFIASSWYYIRVSVITFFLDLLLTLSTFRQDEMIWALMNRNGSLGSKENLLVPTDK
jgi:hypothetical protein